jgi:hypothetical protein
MIISYFEKLLQRLGIIDGFDKDDIVNAEIEDKLRGYEKAVEGYAQASRERRLSNQVLRHTLEIAKERSKSFSEMEELVKHQGAAGDRTHPR